MTSTKISALFYFCSLLLIGPLLLSACGHKGGNAGPVTVLSSGTWTWMSGSDVINTPGVYGTKGVPAPTNLPGARQFAASWTDPAGAFWLFGGFGVAANGDTGYLNDLWKFDGTNWTWISGSDTINAIGTYGTQGQPAADNVPGARESASFWTDAGGNLWLFGGLESTGGVKGHLNDLWKFDPTNLNWTWISGTQTINAEGSFDAAGQPVPGSVPDARFGGASWTDKNGIFWLFGGFGSSRGINVHLNDLWKFDPAATTWTFVSGGPLTAGGNYNPQVGVTVPGGGNIPGARREAVIWTDTNGNLWLFGGFGLANGGISYLNDLWKFDQTNWTWMAGSNGVNGAGIIGTPPAAAPGNTPGSRGAPIGWTDAGGNFWLFGGTGIAVGGAGRLNDLWKFDGTHWAWISGSNGIYPGDLYGTRGVPAPGNTPGGREGAVPFSDQSGNFWFFGGLGSGGAHNDLWRYQP